MYPLRRRELFRCDSMAVRGGGLGGTVSLGIVRSCLALHEGAVGRAVMLLKRKCFRWGVSGVNSSSIGAVESLEPGVYRTWGCGGMPRDRSELVLTGLARSDVVHARLVLVI